nr:MULTISPECIES: TonB-dependent receptor [Providencia]
MVKFKPSFICFIILSTLSFTTHATNKELESPQLQEAADAIELQDSYARPDYVEIERLRDTKQVIVISKEDIQGKGNRTISDVLKSVPGISVDTSGQGNIDLRGQGAETSQRNLQVLLDGAPITTLANHPYTTNYDIIPVEQLERIEIIPGGGSVIYGSGTAGGVINITSNLRSMANPKTSVLSEWNSEGYRLNANLGARVSDTFSILGTASKLNRDLYYKDTYRNSEYYSLGGRWDLTPDQSLMLRGSHLTESSQYVKTLTSRNIKKYGKDYVPPDKTVTVGIDENGKLIKKTISGYLIGDREVDSYNLSYQNAFTEKLNFATDVFYTDGFYTNNANWEQKVNQKSHGTKIKLDIGYLDDSNLLFGIDYAKQKASIHYIGSYKKDSKGRYYGVPHNFDYDKTTKAIYALNSLKSDQFVFTQGIRRELSEWSFDKSGTVNGSGTSDRWNTAAELSLAYLYRDTGRIYGRYERGYTLPDGLQISDQSVVNGEKIYTPTKAEDEKYDLFEIGLRDKLAFSTVNITFWTSNTNNQLNRIYLTSVNDAKTMNLLKTRRWGADVDFQQTLGNFTFQESYSWLRGRSDYNNHGRQFLEENGKNTIDYTKSGLTKVPEHSVKLKVKYDFTDDLSGDIQYTYYGSYNNFLSDANKEEDGVVKSRELIDLSVRYAPIEHIELYGGVTNLMNKTYYDYVTAGYGSLIPGNERSFFAGIKATYWLKQEMFQWL